jgi:hypothetical protein
MTEINDLFLQQGGQLLRDISLASNEIRIIDDRAKSEINVRQFLRS